MRLITGLKLKKEKKIPHKTVKIKGHRGKNRLMDSKFSHKWVANILIPHLPHN